MSPCMLITGFDPFGGETLNLSWEAVCALPAQVGDWRLERLQLPTVFGLAGQRLLAAAREKAPRAILCVGQAAGRDALTPEMVAINLRAARIADNAGAAPQDEPVVPGAPAAYFATLPVRAMAAAAAAAGLPARVSYSAGTFVCNDVFYTALHAMAGGGAAVGFVHLPVGPLPADELARGLQAMIAACRL